VTQEVKLEEVSRAAGRARVCTQRTAFLLLYIARGRVVERLICDVGGIFRRSKFDQDLLVRDDANMATRARNTE
jgi:hypothetical protein